MPMNIVFLLIGVSFVIAIIFLLLFFKSVKSGQYDDTYTPSVRMLFDDELVEDINQNKNNQN
jgi:cbb3-type cytochrome oxidase maturation protein